MIPFERTAIGAATASFTDLERELLTDLATQVIELLGEPPDAEFAGIGGGDGLSADPAIARLLPDAYRDDAEASREFRRIRLFCGFLFWLRCFDCPQFCGFALCCFKIRFHI